MIRMRMFMIEPGKFDLTNFDEDLKSKGEKGIARYNQKMEMREKELKPIEDFIEKIGYNNVRNILTSTGSPYYITYTIFYEDNKPGRM